MVADISSFCPTTNYPLWTSDLVAALLLGENDVIAFIDRRGVIWYYEQVGGVVMAGMSGLRRQ